LLTSHHQTFFFITTMQRDLPLYIESRCHSFTSIAKFTTIKFRLVSFYTRVMLLKSVMQSEQKFPLTTAYFLGVGVLTTSTYIEYDYTDGGHTDLRNIYVPYIQCVYISIQYTYISIQYIYLCLMQ